MRVVAAVMLTVAVVWLADSGSWSWRLLALLAGLAGANLGRSSLVSTTKPLTSSWWAQGKRPILALAFAAGLSVSGFLVGSVVFLLGELQVTLRTIDRIVFGFFLVLAMLFIDSDRYKRRTDEPQAHQRTEPDMTKRKPVRSAFGFGVELGSGSQAFRHSVAPHVVVVVAVLTNPGFVESVVICGVFGLSRLTPLVLPPLRDLSRPTVITNAQLLAIPALTLLLVISLIEAFPLATVDQTQIAATPQPHVNWTKIDIDRDVIPRSDYSLTIAGNQAFIWGGITDDEFSATGLVLDATGEVAHVIGEAPIDGRRYHTAVWTGTELIVWGGSSQFGLERHADGAAYNPTTDQWRVIASSPLDGVWGHTAVWTGSEMVIWGGTSGPDLRSGLGAAYNPATDTWRFTRAAKISARSDHSAAWTGSEMVIWGGVTDKWVNDGAAYNPTTNRWRELAEGPLDDVQDALVTWTGTDVLVAGGTSDAGPSTDAALWNPQTNRWKRLPPTPAPSLSAANATWVGEVLIAVTGDATIIFDTRTLLWSSAPPPGTEAIGGYSPQGVNDKLLLFGGYSLNSDAGPFNNELWVGEVTFPSRS